MSATLVTANVEGIIFDYRTNARRTRENDSTAVEDLFVITAKGHEASERRAFVSPETDPVTRLFGPERCQDCGEALTPSTLKGRDGRARLVQCRCDEWGGRL